MSFLTVLLIALALAVDAFTVAMAAGVVLPKSGLRPMLRLAWHFGLFQTGMNVLGWLAGQSVRVYIEAADHWIAFGLLSVVGGRMIVEALKKEDGKKESADPTRGGTLVVLSVATSIDSLAVGLSFSLLDVSIWKPALVIGVVAFLLTALGMRLGRMVGEKSRLGARAEIVGGLVLIGIGIKILQEHQVFG